MKFVSNNLEYSATTTGVVFETTKNKDNGSFYTITQGQRTEQQDDGISLPPIEPHDYWLIRTAEFQNTLCAELQRVLTSKIPQYAQHSGCTATGVFIGKDKNGNREATICHVGDGFIGLINEPDHIPEQHEKTTSVKVTQLNKEVHHPTDAKEQQRLKKAGVIISNEKNDSEQTTIESKHLKSGNKKTFIQDGRLNDHLALSRSFGHTSFKEDIVIQTPEVCSVSLAEKDKILLSCDGVGEEKVLKNAKVTTIAEFIEQTLNQKDVTKPSTLAIAEAAYKNGSGDNISVFETSAEGAHFIFDGHGPDGEKVSACMQEIIPGVLEDTLRSEKLNILKKLLFFLVKECNLPDLQEAKTEKIQTKLAKFIELFNDCATFDKDWTKTNVFPSIIPYTIELEKKVLAFSNLLQESQAIDHAKLLALTSCIHNKIPTEEKLWEGTKNLFNSWAAKFRHPTSTIPLKDVTNKNSTLEIKKDSSIRIK